MFSEKIHAVTVSRGYGDFLSESAKYNRALFDRWTVVTTPDDEETREVCRRYRLHCLVTEDDTRDGEFSKGRLIERGLQHLPAEGWVLHLDADIVLPATFRHDLGRAHLQNDCIYGCDRFMVKSEEQWRKLVDSGWPFGRFAGHPHALTIPNACEIGARWVGSDGWVPIGFFQLWNRVGNEEEWRGSRSIVYSNSHGNACRSDVQYGLLRDRKKRVLLPELYVAHLESEDSATGVNWSGRKSRRFGTKVPTPQKTETY